MIPDKILGIVKKWAEEHDYEVEIKNSYVILKSAKEYRIGIYRILATVEIIMEYENGKFSVKDIKIEGISEKELDEEYGDKQNDIVKYLVSTYSNIDRATAETVSLILLDIFYYQLTRPQAMEELYRKYTEKVVKQYIEFLSLDPMLKKLVVDALMIKIYKNIIENYIKPEIEELMEKLSE